MAIALNGGHVARAKEFYRTPNKYFILGGTTPWQDETNPDKLTGTEFRLNGVIGLKKVDNIHLVIPVPAGQEAEGDIQYRQQNWRPVKEEVVTTLMSSVRSGDTNIVVQNPENLLVGSKIRVNNLYEGVITARSGNELTLSIAAPEDVPSGSKVLGGAEVEGAKYVYVDCYLNYNAFPVGNNYAYRQLGLCTNVVVSSSAANDDILLSAGVEGRTSNDYSSLGILEILDNRVPAIRDIDQREQLSLIIEF